MNDSGSAARSTEPRHAVHYPEVADMLQERDTLQVKVTGNCMLPLLQHDQCITVCKQNRYRIGDIIVFADAKGALKVHRYLGPMTRNRVMTQADTANTIDAPVPMSQVMGRAHKRGGSPLTVSATLRFRSFIRYIYWYARLGMSRILRFQAGK